MTECPRSKQFYSQISRGQTATDVLHLSALDQKLSSLHCSRRSKRFSQQQSTLYSDQMKTIISNLFYLFTGRRDSWDFEKFGAIFPPKDSHHNVFLTKAQIEVWPKYFHINWATPPIEGHKNNHFSQYLVKNENRGSILPFSKWGGNINICMLRTLFAYWPLMNSQVTFCNCSQQFSTPNGS